MQLPRLGQSRSVALRGRAQAAPLAEPAPRLAALPFSAAIAVRAGADLATALHEQLSEHGVGSPEDSVD
eukprot:8490702-Lingulodinium_polyedra.AAC.1